MEMKALGYLSGLHIFLMGDPTVDFWMLMGSVFRPVLIHDIDIGVRRDLFSDEPQDCFR
jgi:hypothetical protein